MSSDGKLHSCIDKSQLINALERQVEAHVYSKTTLETEVETSIIGDAAQAHTELQVNVEAAQAEMETRVDIETALGAQVGMHEGREATLANNL